MELSITFENLDAILDLILHISTYFFYVDIPYVHFYNYSNKLFMFQFHDLALVWTRNFYNFEVDFLVSFLTTYLSFKKFLIVSDKLLELFTAGSRYIKVFGC